jgi:hypothetical protein
MEAMSAARPVVSTRLAGIPELVVHEETGLLLRPGDTMALVEALEQLIRNRELRLRYGLAGRMRIEQHFRIEQTIRPLIELLQRTCIAPPKPKTAPGLRQIAYLIDRWPDKNLPLIERELEEMNRRNISIVPFVCELDSAVRLTRVMERMTPRLEFLPDAMVIEAEWRANPALTQKLEEQRAQETERVPEGIFLRQARFALVLRRSLLEKNVSHIHATTSRALVCALILQELVDVTVSATIERRPELPQKWIRSALRRCDGGRLSDRKMLRSYDDSFLRDKAASRSLPRKVVGLFGVKIGMDLTGAASFWQEWSELLKRWRRENTPGESKASA